MLVFVYTCQNATLLEISCRGSYGMFTFALRRMAHNRVHKV